MEDKIQELFTKVHKSEIDLYQLEFEILSLMGENEIDASDAPTVKHDAYAVDGDSYASGGTSEISEHTSSAAMEIITEAKEDFFCVQSAYIETRCKIICNPNGCTGDYKKSG